MQVSILPVAEEHEIYAEQVEKALRNEGFRVDMERASNSLGKRIRDVKSQKIPYVLVVGSEDIESQTVGVNPRGGEVERGVPLDEFMQALSDEVKSQL